MTSAAVIAMVLFAVFGTLGFGWRSWLQYRRTGSTGLRRIKGGVTDWIAGAGFALAVTSGKPVGFATLTLLRIRARFFAVGSGSRHPRRYPAPL